MIRRMEEGDEQAADELYNRVHRDLRRLAGKQMSGQRGGHTLQPTALVNEACLRLFGLESPGWKDREHFLAVAASAMRSVLVDHARERYALKRGGDRNRISMDIALDVALDAFQERALDVLGLHDALERLALEEERQARIVELRFFGGMTNAEASRAIGISTATAERDWHLARMWLRRELEN